MNIIVLPIIVAVVIASIFGVYSVSTNSEYTIADTAMNEMISLSEKNNEIIVASVKDNILRVDNHGLKESEIYIVDFVLEDGSKKRILYDDAPAYVDAVSNLNVIPENEDLMIQGGAEYEIDLAGYNIGTISEIKSASITTISGNTFAIDLPSRLAEGEDGTGDGEGDGSGDGDGQAMINGLGISSRIIQTQFTDGRMTHGTGMIGKDVSIEPYVDVDEEIDFASLVREGDEEIKCLIPELYRTYQYNDCNLVDITPNESPNIFSYSAISNGNTPSSVRSNGVITITYSDQLEVNIRDDGIVLSGTGKAVLKPHHALTQDFIFRGTDMNNADVKIVTSVLPLEHLGRSQGEFIIYDEFDRVHIVNSQWSRITHSHGDGSNSHTHNINNAELLVRLNLIIDPDIDLRAHIFSFLQCYEREIDDRCHGLVPGYDTHYNDDDPRTPYHNHSIELVKTSIPTVRSNIDDTSTITELRTAHTFKYSSTPSDERRFTINGVYVGSTSLPKQSGVQIYSEEPFIIKDQYTDNFGKLSSLPEDTYIVVTLDDGSVKIRGESIEDKSYFLKIQGIPPNTPYQIIKDDNPIVTGMSSSTGHIVIDSFDNADMSPFINGAFLKLYPNSLAYRGDFSTIVFDGLNGCTSYLDTEDDKTYVVHAYTSIPVTGEIIVTNTNLGRPIGTSLPQPCIDKTYSTGDHIQIPVIPGYFIINMEINGIAAQLPYADVIGDDGITLIEPSTSTIKKHSLGTPLLSANATVGVTAYAIATSPGTMKAVITEVISGDAEIVNKYTLNTPPPPPAPPRPRDPLSGYVDIFVNGELIKSATLGVNDDPTSVPLLNTVRHTITKGITYSYPEQTVTTAVSVPVVPGDFVEFYVYGGIFGEIDDYTAPAGRTIVSIEGKSSATVTIHSAYIVTDN